MFLDSRASPDCHEDHDPGVVEAGGGGWQHVRRAAEDGHPGQSGQPTQLGAQTRRGQLIGGGHHLGGGAGQRGHLQTQGASDKACMTKVTRLYCDSRQWSHQGLDDGSPRPPEHSTQRSDHHIIRVEARRLVNTNHDLLHPELCIEKNEYVMIMSYLFTCQPL